MKSIRKTFLALTTITLTLIFAPLAHAAKVDLVTTFATGAAVSATGPDSIALGSASVWVSYTNGASSTGGNGSSTIVQYDMQGNILNKYTVAGSVDGLKVQPDTGMVWCLQNQDGNSTLTLIVPGQGITPQSPYQYAVPSSMQGYDDVVFFGDRVFLSYTNPVNPTDPTIQLLINGSNPLAVTPVLTMGATGTNLVTGQTGQPTAQHDPDSLKLTPHGDLMLTSGDDGQLILVSHPGTPAQAVSFIQLLDQSGSPVSGLDDALFVTDRKGIFLLADTSNNRVLAIEVDEISSGSLFASVGSLNEFATVDLTTGKVTALVSNLRGPHGLVFVPIP
jgi:hypothetical protein